jgi:endonuclease-3
MGAPVDWPATAGAHTIPAMVDPPAHPPVTRRRGRESKKARRARADEIQARLAARYPSPTTALGHGSAWELLVATILSAQATDETVNKVTPGLFARYPTVASFAAADREELERAIHATGFFRSKARALQGAARYLLDHHGGEVPNRMEDLVRLPGVGRKTANVVLGSYFGRNDGVVVDTHVGRLSRRLGLTRHEDAEKVELDLMALVPVEEWTNVSHRLIYFGREVCTAKDPRCDACELADLCPSAFRVGRWAKPVRTPRKAAGPAGAGRGTRSAGGGGPAASGGSATVGPVPPVRPASGSGAGPGEAAEPPGAGP